MFRKLDTGSEKGYWEFIMRKLLAAAIQTFQLKTLDGKDAQSTTYSMSWWALYAACTGRSHIVVLLLFYKAVYSHTTADRLSCNLIAE